MFNLLVLTSGSWRSGGRKTVVATGYFVGVKCRCRTASGTVAGIFLRLNEMSIVGFDFADVSSEARRALSEAMSRRSFANNEVIYLQEDDADNLYFVAAGHVRLSYIMEDGSAILYAILPSGQCFGELGVFDGGKQVDMATSLGTSTVAFVSTRSFRSLASRFPELRDVLAGLVARRYRSYIDLTRNLSLKTLPARVSQALLRLADGLGSRTTYGGREVPVVGAVVTQSDLGLMARGARGNVNRALKAWERNGWIVIRDRAILVVNRSKLEALSFEDDF